MSPSCSSEFQPYVDHGGTVVGIAGDNFCVIAADTRLSESYSIYSRNFNRIIEVQHGLFS